MLKKEHIKFILDILEDITSIIVSLGAVWGTIIAFESGFIHKLNHLVNHYHDNLTRMEETLKQEKIMSVLSDMEKQNNTEQREISDIQNQEKEKTTPILHKETDKPIRPDFLNKKYAPDKNPIISNTAQR
ncbi:MAG: hypothetical protein ACI4QM_04240 [Alphaproteobacteria bacterium]